MSEIVKTPFVNPLDNEFKLENIPAPTETLTAEPEAVVESPKVRHEMDFGDGAGKRVLEADTHEALLQAITNEQSKAADIIRQRSARKKPDEKAVSLMADPKELSADDLFSISQELQKNPTGAFDKIMQAQTGMTAKELREEILSIRQQRAASSADQAFLSAHATDYKPSATNAKHIVDFLSKEKLAYTGSNLEYAYQELTEQGVLEKPDASKVEVPAHTRNKPMTSGLTRAESSTTRPSAVTVNQQELEDEKFRKMSADERRSHLFALQYAAKTK